MTIKYRYCMAVVSLCCERNGTNSTLSRNLISSEESTRWFTALRMTSGLYDLNVLGYLCATIFYRAKLNIIISWTRVFGSYKETYLKVSFKVKVRIDLWNWGHEVGFNSNQKVERSGEYGSSVRTNRPSPSPSKKSWSVKSN